MFCLRRIRPYNPKNETLKANNGIRTQEFGGSQSVKVTDLHVKVHWS